MPSLQAAIRAAAQHRAQRSAGQKSLVRSGPTMQPQLVGRPLQQREWLTETAVERYFKLSGLVYRSAVSLATAVGSVRWQVEVRAKDRWELAGDDHELQRLLDRPHPYYNRQAWNEAVVLYLVLVGDSFTQKTLASGKPTQGAKAGRILEMVPLVPDGINPVPDPETWISHYEFKGPPQRRWEREEMLHILLPDPGNPYRGMSPFRSVKKIIQTDLAAIDWNHVSMANRAISDGVFSVEHPLTEKQWAEYKDQLWEQHQGGPNAHEPMVLGGGTEWLPMERTPVEMDFNATRMRLREDVLSSAGIPPVVAGYFENATLANADASRRIFWEDSLIPAYVERVAGSLNSSVVPHFGDAATLRVTYDVSGVPALRDDLVKKAGALRILVSAGTPYNDAVAELELDLAPIPGLGDVPFGLETLRTAPAADPALDGADAITLAGKRVTGGRIAKAMLRATAAAKQAPPPARAPERKLNLGIRTTTFAADVADQEAPAIRRMFLAAVAKLRDGASLADLAALLTSSDAAAAIQRLGGHQLSGLLGDGLGKLLQRTAERGAELGAEKLAQDLAIDASLNTSSLRSWLQPYVTERVGQLVNTTEAAARDFFFDLAAGKLGTNREAAAQLLRDTWGLHRQQASGVRNVFSALLDRGKSPADAAATAGKLARVRLHERAKTIAEHESLVAANRGHGLLFDQALADGQVSEVTVTWVTNDTDVDEECLSLEDQEITLGTGERFVGASGQTYREPPEPHPNCKCGLLVTAI